MVPDWMVEGVGGDEVGRMWWADAAVDEYRAWAEETCLGSREMGMSKKTRTPWGVALAAPPGNRVILCLCIWLPTSE